MTAALIGAPTPRRRPPASGPTGGDGEQIGVNILPRRRMQRVLVRRFLLVVVVQFVATCLVLLLMQGPWRERQRADHGMDLAQLTADRLDGQLLDGRNLVVQQALEQVVEQPGVLFAALFDAEGRVVCRRPPAPDDGSPLIDLADGLAPRVDVLANRIVYVLPIKSPFTGTTFQLAVGADDLAARRAVTDGAIAALLGLLVVLTAVIPVVRRRFAGWTLGLRQLHASVRRLALDRPVKSLPVGGDDEIAYLAVAFNDMAGRLCESHRRLRDVNVTLEQRVARRTDELREANEELAERNDQLARLTEKAMQFTDDVAHEFRTPLTVIREFASITAEGLGGQVTDTQGEYLQFIINATGELAQLVDDFLDSGKLRAGTLRVERRSCTADEILDPIWPMLEMRASSRHLTLKRSIDSARLPRLWADTEKAGRALMNLVTNAIKFSPDRGAITVSVEPHESRAAAVFSVTDQGRGLPPEEVETLFQRFRQGGEGARSAAKGFGLGLNIVRDLVGINLGSLDVRSQVGHGSTFSFTVPIDAPGNIIDSFLRCTRERDPEAAISAIRVRPSRPDADGHSLGAFLAGTCHPTDVVLGPDEHGAYIAAGATPTAEGWCRKLLMTHARSWAREGAAPPEIHQLGTWPIAEAREALRACVVSTTGVGPAPCHREGVALGRLPGS